MASTLRRSILSKCARFVTQEQTSLSSKSDLLLNPILSRNRIILSLPFKCHIWSGHAPFLRATSHQLGGLNNANNTTRLLGSKAKQEKEAARAEELKDWIPVYRFNHIFAARNLQRFKVYQTAFSCLLITPASLALHYYNMLDDSGLATILGGSIFTCGVLYFFGNIFSKLVAIVYTSPEKYPEKMRIARLTFWGQREDEIHDITDFAPISDLSYKPHDLYFKLRQYSNYDCNLYFSATRGTVENVEEFQRVFGGIPMDLRISVSSSRDS